MAPAEDGGGGGWVPAAARTPRLQARPWLGGEWEWRASPSFPPALPHPQMWQGLQNVLDKIAHWTNDKSKYGREIGGTLPPPLLRPQKPRPQRSQP